MKSFMTVFCLLSCFTFQYIAQEFKFEKETIDYGKIKKDSDGERTFFIYKYRRLHL